MTNKEAMASIKYLINAYEVECRETAMLIKPKDYEAFKLAIKSLEQQSCEDCISREHAKQFLYYEIEQLHDDGLYDCFSRIIDDMYNDLPSVTPQRPKGKWIYEMQVMNNPYTYKCSVCKGWEKDKTKYCPNCGSYNGGGEDGRADDN